MTEHAFEPALSKEKYENLNNQQRSDAEDAHDQQESSQGLTQEFGDEGVLNPKYDPRYIGKLACADEPTSTFYSGDLKIHNEAVRICKTCVAQDDCAEYAIRHNEADGVWGGLSERARRRIRKARGLTKSRK